MSAISISAPGYSGGSLTSGFRRRRLSWYVPSLVCHLFAQFSINASTSDCATASLSDNAINSFLKSKTNGSPCSVYCFVILNVIGASFSLIECASCHRYLEPNGFSAPILLLRAPLMTSTVAPFMVTWRLSHWYCTPALHDSAWGTQHTGRPLAP